VRTLRRAVVVPLALLAWLAPSATAMPPACSPPGSRVVDGSVVRWHRVTWFCAMHPRRLVVLPLPPRSRSVDHVVARGRFVAFSYDQETDPDCEYFAPAARSIDRNTGEVVFELPARNPCVDVYSARISDVALRSVTGAFAVIRHVDDYEDDNGSAEVVAVSAAGRRVLDSQDRRPNFDTLSGTRIFGGTLYYAEGRLHYKRRDGWRTARL
jgi:hypothetical protein